MNKFLPNSLIKRIASIDTLYICILIAFAIITHIHWFTPESVIAWGDWYYWYDETASELHKSWGTWLSITSLGNANIQVSFLAFKSLWALLVNNGISFDFASKLTFFIPIAILSFISPFLLIRHLVKNSFIAFIVSFFYGTTTYGIFIQPPIQFVYSLAPLVLLSFIHALEKNTLLRWILFVCIYSIGLSYELRIMLIVTGVLGMYFLFFALPDIKKYIRNLLITLVLFIGLNAYWILPLVSGGTSQEISTLTSRDLFGDSLYSLSNAFTLFNWLWTGGYPNKEFVAQPIISYFWIIPFLAFTPLAFSVERTRKKQILFFSTIALLGIFLTKQSGAPFNSFYRFAYENLPGFNLFRESSKFYLLSAIGYTGCFAFLLHMLSTYKTQKKRIIYLTITTIILFLGVVNTKPLITGEIGTQFVPRTIHQDYLTYKNLLNTSDEQYRVLWVPYYSRWSMFDMQNPELSSVTLLNTRWSEYVRAPETKKSDGEISLEFLESTVAGKLLDISSIKYVAVPLEDTINDDNIFSHYGLERSVFIDRLNQNRHVKKINVQTDELALYENSDYYSRIYITREKEHIQKKIDSKNIPYQINTSSEYSTVVTTKDPVYLNFSEGYHSEWKIRVGEFKWWKGMVDSSYFLPDSYHFSSATRFNGFYVDPQVVCSNRSCKKNSDGSYTIPITIYFKPQSYMYLGIIISITTVSILMGYAGIRALSRKMKRV